MADNLDNVFVSLSYDSMLYGYSDSMGMRVLEWALDRFDSDKTKIILTPIYDSDDTKNFTEIAQEKYLPRCAKKKFRAEILLPRATNVEDIILELVNKHAMKKLVYWSYAGNHWKLTTCLDNNPTICCKIWVVHHYGELILVRDTELDRDVNDKLQKIIMEVRNSWPNGLAKKMLLVHEESMTNLKLKLEKLREDKKELLQRENLEKDLHRRELELEEKLRTEAAEELRLLNEEKLNDMRESARKKEEANDLLFQENTQLKQHISDSKLVHDDLQAKLLTIKNHLDSLQSDYIALQAERDDAVKEVEKLHNGISFSDFTLQELKNATQNFSASLELGKGAFGCVYKGYIRKKNVAIKILNSESMESISGFNTEVAILSTIRHPNIVTLLGACHDASALVFEFLPNGSLESHLECANKATSLTWQIRTHIMAEISLALIFLHSNAENMIIHGDLKPDNILLDAKFVSKLGDFGISRFLKKPDSDSTACYETYHPIGTPGYMDPEFVNSGMLTEKSDVYSFGVVILRLLTRKPAMCIALHVENAIENGTFHEILDACAGEWPLDQAKELAKLALRCAQVARKDRPNLFEVWPIIERLRRDL